MHNMTHIVLVQRQLQLDLEIQLFQCC